MHYNIIKFWQDQGYQISYDRFGGTWSKTGLVTEYWDVRVYNSNHNIYHDLHVAEKIIDRPIRYWLSEYSQELSEDEALRIIKLKTFM